MTIVIAIFLILHGLVHGILVMMPNRDDPDAEFGTFYSESWLLSRLGLSESASKTLVLILSATATIGFIATGLALLDFLVPIEWWRTLATASTVVSLLLLVLFWSRHLIAGVLIDALILGTVFFTDWTPE